MTAYHGPASRNVIGSSAQIAGLVVQAEQVHGGIHHHPLARELPPTPRQLPRLARHFLDREEETAALDKARRGGASLAVISGLAGVGKTALATRWLGAVAAPGQAQLHADLSGPAGPVAPEVVLEQWLRALGLDRTPSSLPELSGLWRSATTDHAVTILVDNAVSAEQVRPLLPAAPASMTVVTSRRSLQELWCDGAASCALGPLPQSAAMELLISFAGEERIAAEREAAVRLIRACAGLPLALVLVGARLGLHTARSLAAAAAALVHPHREDPARMAVTAGMTESYNSLSSTAQSVYRMLGWLPVTAVDAEMIAAACPLQWAEADRALDALADAHLLEPRDAPEHQQTRYHVGAAVREHAGALATQHDGAPRRDDVVRRLCTWMLALATQAQQRLTPAQSTLRRALAPPADAPGAFADDGEAMAWLQAQEHDLRSVLQAAEAAGLDEEGWQLVDAFWPLFLRRHPYALWIAAHEIGLAAARRVGNRAAVRQMLLSGAIGLASAGRLADAVEWYTEALHAAQADRDVRDEGQALLGLGTCHHEAGRPEDAEPHLIRAVALWTRCEYPRGVALAQTVRGDVALARGEAHRALDQLAQAYTALQDLGDTYDAHRALALHGHARVQLGELDAGIDDLEAATRVFAAASGTQWHSRTLAMLGQAHRQRGDAESAQACYRQAADLVELIRPADAQRFRQTADEL